MQQPISRAAMEWTLFVVGTCLLTVGAAAWLMGASVAASAIWTVGTGLGVAVSVVVTAATLARRQPSVDVIALLALLGALAVGEAFAGAMITVMLLTGRLLDARAELRAQRDLRLLAERAPRHARRLSSSDDVEDVPLDELAIGDRLVVGAGEIVPVDGRLTQAGTFDESALTGEPLPVYRAVGDEVRSGVVNAGGPAVIITTVLAAESTYAGVVRLVKQAQAANSPFVRLADRLAVWFVPATLIVAAAAWAISGQASRSVAVLVVATPCPLLLAAPIALMSGLSRTARLGIIVKGGAALEQLAAGNVIMFDKTGTLTIGQPRLTSVLLADEETTTTSPPPRPRNAAGLLRLAASLDQLSPHILATAVVSAALRDELKLSMPRDVHELHGRGIEGTVDGQLVRLGKADWVLPATPGRWADTVRRRADLDAAMTVFISVDDVPAGALLFTDPLRPDAARLVRALRATGIRRVVLVTGDRLDVATRIGRLVGVDEVFAGCDPARKLDIVSQESKRASTVMVGDGINDAPALAAAGTGVALAARGATASSEAADVVLTVDRVDALATAMQIAQACRRIAMQAVGVGMGLSVLAMAFASAGLLPAALGAAIQEVIDVLAILIALRALRAGPGSGPVMSADERQVVAALRRQHESTQPLIDQISAVADALTHSAPDVSAAVTLIDRLASELLTHERADEHDLIPLVARALNSVEATAPLSLSHAEIEHQVTRLQRLLTTLPPTGPTPSDVTELRRSLYELHATIQLHNAQEEEGVSSLGTTARTD